MTNSARGNQGAFRVRLLAPLDARITVADVLDCHDKCTERGLTFVKVSENGPLPFVDTSFDIVLCNSVIEHVTLPKSECRRLDIADTEWSQQALRAQEAFAKEIHRVGKAYFVQTPHPSFPIDLHLWLPFTHWLGHRNVVRLSAVTSKYWIKQASEADWGLVSPNLLQCMFPNGRIHIERFLGMPKLIAYKPIDH